MGMDRRAEVLFSEEEYEELRRQAERRGISFGELIRDTARRVYLQPSRERREAAFEFLINGPEVAVGNWPLQRFNPVGLAAG